MHVLPRSATPSGCRLGAKQARFHFPAEAVTVNHPPPCGCMAGTSDGMHLKAHAFFALLKIARSVMTLRVDTVCRVGWAHDSRCKAAPAVVAPTGPGYVCQSRYCSCRQVERLAFSSQLVPCCSFGFVLRVGTCAIQKNTQGQQGREARGQKTCTQTINQRSQRTCR